MSVIINWISQVFVVTLLNLRTIRQRLASSLVAIVGIAGVVAVFVAVLSMAEGFRKTMATTGSPDTAIVMRSGADSEMTSILLARGRRLIGDAPGVRRAAERPHRLGRTVRHRRPAQEEHANTTANVPLRGVGPTRSRCGRT